MTTTLKKLPAILLAVIMATMLALAIGALSQPAYADDEGNGYQLIVVPAEEGDDMVLPGQKLLMKAEVYDDEGENVTGKVIIQNPQWAVAEGSEYAECELVPDDSLHAYLVFKNLPEDLDVDEVYASLQLTAEVGGQVLASNAYPVACTNSYYKLVYSEINKYMLPGTTQEITGQVLHFSVEHPEGAPVSDVTYTWEDNDKNIETIEPMTATGESITSVISRTSEDADLFVLHASWKDEAGETRDEYEYIFLDEVTSNLEDFEVVVDPDVESWKTVIPEGSSYVPTIQVVNGDYVLPADVYDIIVERYVGWDEETGMDKFEPYCVNMETPLVVSEKDAKDEEGRPIGGTNIFRFTAKAKEGSGFTGQTDEFPGFSFLYSDKTLNDYAADVNMKNAAGESVPVVFTDVYPYARFETTPGAPLTPSIMLNDKELAAGDYEITYTNVSTGEETSEFPTAIGEYYITVVGAGEYYGSDDSTYLKVGEPNTMTVKAPAVKAKAKKNTVKKKAIKVQTNGDVYFYKGAVNGKYVGKPYNKIQVKENGTITVKKGLKKGTYKLEVFVSTPGDDSHLSLEQEVIIKIKVK